MPYGTGRGIARGFEKATNTVLNIQLAKNKLEYKKEQDKVEQGYKKAQTNLAEFKIKDAERESAREDAKFAFMKGLERGGGIGGGASLSESVDPGEVFPGYDYSLDVGGVRLTPKKGLTVKQRQDEDVRVKEMNTQKQGAIGAVNSIKNQILEKGTLSSKKQGEIPYTRGTAQAYIAKNFPKVDINDSDVQDSLFSLENMAPDFRPSFGIKAAVGRGRAKLSRPTKELIKTINSQEALDKIVGSRKELEAEDVDVDAILEYFGQRK